MAAFPTSIDEVTVAWLTDSLRSSGALGAASVLGFGSTPIGVGVGLLGLLYRLTLEYDTEGAGPDTAVLKVASVDPGPRHVARTFGFYQHEVGFYRDFAAVTPMSIPHCMAAAHDPESDDFVLLLADVDDAEVYSQVDGCPPEIAHVAARALARHHAAFADSALFDHPDHAWLTYASDSPTPEGVIQGVTDAWPGFRETFPELADAALESLVERYVASVHSLMEIPAGRPITLGHGDYRLDNLFFGADGEVTVLDWQLCAKVNFAYDLAYFLTQSLTIGDRRAHEAAIIDSYFDELEAAGATHDRDDFMEDFRGAVMFCLCYPLQSGAFELANDRARDLVADMFRRSMAAIEDHDATELLIG